MIKQLSTAHRPLRNTPEYDGLYCPLHTWRRRGKGPCRNTTSYGLETAWPVSKGSERISTHKHNLHVNICRQSTCQHMQAIYMSTYADNIHVNICRQSRSLLVPTIYTNKIKHESIYLLAVQAKTYCELIKSKTVTSSFQLHHTNIIIK